MEFGVTLRHLTNWSDIRSAALAAEDAGFDSIWVVDHLLAVPPRAGMMEAWTLLSALAASTSRVGIGAQVLCQSFRSPGLLAKMATTLDDVSGGRLRFLIGAGWNEAEYRAFGYPYPSPGERLEQLTETLTVLRGLWDCGDEPFTYEGKHVQISEALNLPAPTRRISLGVGGHGPRLIRLAARVADEWNCPASALPDYERLSKQADDAAAVAGRRLRRTVQIAFTPGDSDASSLQRFHPSLGLTGSTARMVDRVGELAEAGVSGLFGMPKNRAAIDAIGAILPQLRAAAV